MTLRARGAQLARLLLVGLAALLALLLPAGAAPAAHQPAAAPGVVESTTALPVEIAVESVSPQVLRPGQDLILTVTLRNLGTVPLAEPRVTVMLKRDPFVSRSSLDRWRAAGPLDDAGREVARLDLPGPLSPGQAAPVTVTVPAASVGLRRTLTSWGPRGLALQVVDRADPTGQPLGHQRTFALWFPEQDVTATRVSVVAPVVGPRVDPQSPSWGPELERLTRPGGRLAALLAATAAGREVTWVVDPWLLEATSQPTRTAQTDEGRAGPQARAWADDLVAALPGRDVRLLPYGDADVMALAHAGAPETLATAMARGRAVAADSPLPDSADATIAWPAAPLPDLATAAFVSDEGMQAVLVGPGEMTASSLLTYTPSGRTTVSTATGEVTVLVPDERLSTALATGYVRGDVLGDEAADEAADDDGAAGSPAPAGPTPGTLTPAVAAQDLLAELAVITRERPNDARHLLMTAERDWSPDPKVATAQLAALSAAPWVRVEPVSALIGAQNPGEDRGTLPSRAVSAVESGPAEVSALTAAIRDRAAVAEMVEDPDGFVDGVQEELLAPLSVAWRSDPPARAALVARSVATTQALRDAVTVQPVSLRLVSTTGEVPVRLTNTLDQAVTVQVSLAPVDPRLVADETETVTIGPKTETVVQISVHAIQSADVEVGVEVRTPGGTLIDDGTVITVSVRAEWESIGAAVVGAVLALGLIVGLIRTIRRGRSGRRATPIDLGPDALSPEIAAEHDHGRPAGPHPDPTRPAGERADAGAVP